MYTFAMLLKPLEIAILMSAVEQTLVTTRQVYYRIEMCRLIGLKVGSHIRIPIKEIQGYYAYFGTERDALHARVLIDFVNRKGLTVLFTDTASDEVSNALITARHAVLKWRSIQLVRKKSRKTPDTISA